MRSLSLLVTLVFLNSILLISADDYCKRSTDIATACEHSVLDLSCPDHTRIKILAANYGRTERRSCRNRPYGQLRNTHCYTPNAVFIVARRCNWRKRCSVPATNSVFSDPCVGTYKYLRVKYCCRRRRG
ncbi:Gal_Lectin domain-containing protein precursor [Danio rerio]|uniref:Gal_Lectin domain-containing protein precursor n=1 Tax=Danio rerio TaxID=7955 RepID=Q1LVX1_DANRE|nr:Gal_Lectin domain-containing protein precursor [Danio rerio]AAI55625.1 Si:dkeyp-98a7.5 protein [Danio rerio]|eukprot:NP_001128340.2 uncharacterized protein LOC798039 precursor [Danio rerio]